MSTNSYTDDLAAIRSMMEKSSRFISLSGMSGVMAGIYSLVGAAFAYWVIYYSPNALNGSADTYELSGKVLWLFADAAAVIVLTTVTGVYLTFRRASQNNQGVWSELSRRLLINLLIPLVTGGLVVLIMYFKGHYLQLAPLLLIFYGLALVNSSHWTLRDVRYLGISELTLGIIALMFPGYGLFFWTLGFGVLHIAYGLAMYFKYER